MTARTLIIPALLLAGCAASSPGSTNADTPSEPPPATMEALLEEELLKRFPGVRVHHTAEGLQIRIRGSLQPPLFVVDGQPLASTPSGALWGISPYEIEHIEVVKDIGRLSRYGMRGANGVVLITTKRR